MGGKSVKESEIQNKLFKNNYKIYDIFKEILGIEINGKPQNLYKDLNKSFYKNFDVPHDSLKRGFKIILNKKSTLISGRQGSGKSYYAKAMINYIESDSDSNNKNYITSYVKTWDYDYVNNPLLLFMKKIWSSNILKEEHNEILWLLIWSYKNELNKSGYSNIYL